MIVNVSLTPIKNIQTKCVYFHVLHTLTKPHQPTGNNKKFIKTILPISNSIGCDKF